MTDDDVPLASDLIWGAKAISSEIFGSDHIKHVRKTFYMLENKQIPGRKIGDIWVASRKEIRQRLQAP